jgi:drug/metabolite transporter (DMT)-like permease
MIVLMLLGSNGAINDINLGDLLIFIGAAFNALQIVLFEKYVTKDGADLLAINLLYMLFMVLLSFLFSWLFHETYSWNVSPTLIWIWLYLGLITTALTLIIQSWAQQRIESTRAAIIFSFEAVFGTFFGILFLDELLTWQFLMGAGLIMVGVLIASVEFKTKRQPKSEAI